MRIELLSYILVMALTTYLVRMLPMTLLRRKIQSRFAKSFFYYIPYAVLAAMTIPAIFYSTDSILSAAIGFAVAVVLAFFTKSLPIVALVSCVAVFLIGLF